MRAEAVSTKNSNGVLEITYWLTPDDNANAPIWIVDDRKTAQEALQYGREFKNEYSAPNNAHIGKLEMQVVPIEVSIVKEGIKKNTNPERECRQGTGPKPPCTTTPTTSS